VDSYKGIGGEMSRIEDVAWWLIPDPRTGIPPRCILAPYSGDAETDGLECPLGTMLRP
jgi:hypothetical protein